MSDSQVLDPPAAGARTPASAVVEIVLPVYNEQHVLRDSVSRLHRYMTDELAIPFRITVADNASTDATHEIARAVSSELEEVEVLHLGLKGRGRALREAWLRSEADVVAYMDVDLSTDLRALPELLLPLVHEVADIAIGTRLAAGAEVTRGLKRELISRSYNILLRVSLGVGFSDAQCGFKAARRSVIEPLLTQARDDSWFFDTELLYLAQLSKLSIHEVPVRWVEDRDSRVDILATAREDLRGIARLRRAARRLRPDDYGATSGRISTAPPMRAAGIIAASAIAASRSGASKNR
ncbi:MAG: glycosyltransferase [Solirubrobacteraceae bacterium]